MLKRSGQPCEHAVPGYCGRLTNTEFEVYQSILDATEPEINELSAISGGIAQLEQTLPDYLQKISGPSASTARVAAGADWQVIAPLTGAGQDDMLWCKRQVGDLEEFAVAQRFDPNSPLAKTQGDFEVQMTGRDPLRLLRDFINARRETAQLFANDIVATAREQAEQKYPGQDLTRVRSDFPALREKHLL